MGLEQKISAKIELKNACVTYKLPRVFARGIGKQMQHEHLLNAKGKIDEGSKPADIDCGTERSQMRLGKSRKPRIHAIDKISLTISSGERVGIAGGNGAGKTTLLRLMSGLIEPTDGLVETYGTLHSIINMAGGIDPTLTGEQNLKRLAILLRVPKIKRPVYLRSAIEFAQLDSFLRAPVKIYSSGMKFRLLFAAVTSIRPDILVLDEWLGVTDARFQKRAGERMTDMVASTSILILASNNPNSLKRYCERIIVLNKGRVEHDLSTEEYDQYLEEKNASY